MANIYLRALIVGAMAGMRSLVTPSIVSESLASEVSPNLHGSVLSLLAARNVRRVLKAGCTTEIICDKLPFMPDRTDPSSLIFRFISGAVCGAAICKAEGQSSPLGAAIGGVTAVVSAHVCYNIRRKLVADQTASDTLVAVAEDALVMTLGRVAAGA